MAINISYGTDVQMTITALDSQASSATAAWQSDSVDNSSTKAIDYQVNCQFAFGTGTVANDKAVYIYAVPWFWDGGSPGMKCGADAGTTTLPTYGTSGTQADYTIASPNNLILAKVITLGVQSSTIAGSFNLLNVFGSSLPDAWQLIVVNYTGIALAASGNIIQYKPITYTVA